jgi:hypothetical protein
MNLPHVFSWRKNAMKWQRELPDSEGDWMWVWMWSCGCCVQRHGLVWVDQHYFSEEEAKKHYRTINGKFAIHYGSDAPEFGEITAWAKIELPPEDWDFDERVIVPIKPEEVKKVEKPEPKPDSFMEYWLNEKHKTEGNGAYLPATSSTRTRNFY